MRLPSSPLLHLTQMHVVCPCEGAAGTLQTTGLAQGMGPLTLCL